MEENLTDKDKDFLWFCVRNQFTQLEVPYSGKFLLVQNFTEMSPDQQEEIFAVLIFVERELFKAHPYQMIAMPLP